MAKSEAFERNTERVIETIERVPRGRCTSYGAVGRVIGIVPRYVALIMASAPDISASPWHRVVGADATVRPGPHSAEQKKRLEEEGVRVEAGKIRDFDTRFFNPSEIDG
jgi:alkylated DNA nucleotide flippase Atl1